MYVNPKGTEEPLKYYTGQPSVIMKNKTSEEIDFNYIGEIERCEWI